MNSLLPHPRRSHLAAAVCTVLCAVSPWASAQLIDDVEVRRDGDDAVVAIRFVTPVRYTRIDASVVRGSKCDYHALAIPSQ